MNKLDAPITANVLHSLQSREEFLWTNPHYRSEPFDADAAIYRVDEAEHRFARCASLMASAFDDLKPTAGKLQSDLVPLRQLQKLLGADKAVDGQWLMKCDHALPVAGSVKARGGFNEVLCFAEELALKNGILGMNDDRSILLSANAKALFSRYTVAVGSTGNLGLSIGMISAALGFRAVVHRSSDAKDWKKARLRRHGIEVVEHSGDYAAAVAAGRAMAEADEHAYFVDDENSSHLFLGYAAAAKELANQLEQLRIEVSQHHPLFVYLPCGVGGAPGGITYGLKRLFGPHVHCFFAEPTESACMLVQLSALGEDELSVYDIGLTNKTEADGLAVGQASHLVARLMRDLLSGVYTVQDATLYRLRYLLAEAEHMKIEPSAAAGLLGPMMILQTTAGREYVEQHQLTTAMSNATHVIWSTGGMLVPEEEHARFDALGRNALKNNKLF